jgi:hypothetical protein
MVINLWIPSNMGNLQLAEELLVSEEGLCSIELVNRLVNSLVKLFFLFVCLLSVLSVYNLVHHIRVFCQVCFQHTVKNVCPLAVLCLLISQCICILST